MNHQDTGAAPGGAEPTEEELRAQLEEELRRLRVDDILLQTLVSLINLAGRRAGLAGGGPEEVDLGQVEAAIEAVSALLPVVEKRGGAGDLRPLRDALAQLQLAYARAGGAGAPSADPQSPAAAERAPAPGGETAPTPGAQEPPAPSEGAGPAQSSGRLWIPGR